MKDYHNDIIGNIKQLYKTLAKKYEATPKAVGWKDYKSHELCLFDGCLVLDVECSYSALYEYLTKQYNIGYYLGINIIERFINIAKEKYRIIINVNFLLMDTRVR